MWTAGQLSYCASLRYILFAVVVSSDLSDDNRSYVGHPVPYRGKLCKTARSIFSRLCQRFWSNDVVAADTSWNTKITKWIFTNQNLTRKLGWIFAVRKKQTWCVMLSLEGPRCTNSRSIWNALKFLKPNHFKSRQVSNHEKRRVKENENINCWWDLEGLYNTIYMCKILRYITRAFKGQYWNKILN